MKELSYMYYIIFLFTVYLFSFYLSLYCLIIFLCSMFCFYVMPKEYEFWRETLTKKSIIGRLPRHSTPFVAAYLAFLICEHLLADILHYSNRSSVETKFTEIVVLNCIQNWWNYHNVHTGGCSWGNLNINM